MRTIKFRGKRIDNGEWVEGYLFVTTFSTTTKTGLATCIQVVKDDIHYSSHEVNPATVGQFTGLVDKNGKDVYDTKDETK